MVNYLCRHIEFVLHMHRGVRQEDPYSGNRRLLQLQAILQEATKHF